MFIGITLEIEGGQEARIRFQGTPEGGTVTLGARLYLDYFDAKPQKNSVTVTLDSRLVVR